MTQPPLEIPFNRYTPTGRELDYIREAMGTGQIAGGQTFSQRSQRWLETTLGVPRALLTTSCTHALEMAALLLDLQPGDEVIVPSYTFVSTANAFALRGARLRFADNDANGNILPADIERRLSARTRAVVVMHYGGASCDLEVVLQMCTARDIPVIEDAAQAIGATYRGRALGTMGALGCLSFHETKNVTSGEGGAII